MAMPSPSPLAIALALMLAAAPVYSQDQSKVSGEISIGAGVKSGSLTTVSGDIDLAANVRAGSLNTVSGDIDIDSGVVAGAAVGANVNRDDGPSVRNVQRCSSEPRGRQRAEYWDVTYQFRGQEHHMQTTAPPGATVTVNGRGEPRER